MLTGYGQPVARTIGHHHGAGLRGVARDELRPEGLFRVTVRFSLCLYMFPVDFNSGVGPALCSKSRV